MLGFAAAPQAAFVGNRVDITAGEHSTILVDSYGKRSERLTARV
jgi:hypothetical protein